MAAGFEISPAMMQMPGGFTVIRLSSMPGIMNRKVTKEQLQSLNEQLNRIPKE